MALNTHQINLALAAKYCAPEYAFFLEVPSSTGGGALRTIDGLAFGLWPSRGHYFTGFEVKASRADWLRELKNPAKADLLAKYCHFWYLVIGDPSIVKPGELPENWGLIVPKGKSLIIEKTAPRLEPRDLSPGFLASIMRQAQKQLSNTSFYDQQRNEAVLKAREEASKHTREVCGREIQMYKDRLEQLNLSIKAFEDASGLSDVTVRGIWQNGHHYQPASVGAAVKFVLEGGLSKLQDEMSLIKHKAQNVLNAIQSIDEITIENSTRM